jgi:hypothetical protein
MVRFLHLDSRRILPGYYSSEPGVVAIPPSKWERAPGDVRVLTVTDGGESIYLATHLVLFVRASKPGPLVVTRVRPERDGDGETLVACAVEVETAEVGTDWTVVSVARTDFRDAEADVHELKEARNSLVRYELRAGNPDTKFELKASLWAQRAPVAEPEAKR